MLPKAKKSEEQTAKTPPVRRNTGSRRKKAITADESKGTQTEPSENEAGATAVCETCLPAAITGVYCSTCDKLVAEICISLSLIQVPTRAWTFVNGSIPMIFTYHCDSINRALVPPQLFGQKVRMALFPYIYYPPNEQAFYMRLSTRPASIPYAPGLLAMYVSVLVDFPAATGVDEEMVGDVFRMLPREAGGYWCWQYCPTELNPVVWRLKWFENQILRAAWPLVLWSNIAFQPEGERSGVTQMLGFPAAKERGP
ncbi:uncharacterized protein BDV14DRAFT_195410 [Aspergillus stella-maris]|uniref:uncharacterized protein n=1 Tax=Aspergillus stella-maris TaxID=1810926 RepID=UPI003CCD757A